MDYRGVLYDEDGFDGEGGDLGEQNSAEGIGDRGVDVDEREGGIEGGVGVEADLEVLERIRNTEILQFLSTLGRGGD